MIVYPHNYDDVETCLPADVLKQLSPVLEPLRRLEHEDDRKLSARIVGGINCTPYDIAHRRGYLQMIVYPHNYDDVETCLPADVLKQLFPVLEPLRRLEHEDDRKLSARMVGGINCTPYDIAHQRGYLPLIVRPHNYDDVETCP